jgi:pyruvate formate lyase activating enzyme
MTLTGGEPTNQPDFCLSLLKAARERGINTCLDTNGYSKWEIYEKLIDHVDWFLWDIKNMDSEKHKDWAGVSNERILENLKRVVERAKVRIRIPIIPDINDSEENLRKTAEFVDSLGANVEGVDLLPYHPYAGTKYRLFCLDYPFAAGQGYDEDRLLEIMKIFEPHAAEVTIGG